MKYKDPVQVAREQKMTIQDLTESNELAMEERIIHVLTIYPRLMPTMLHTGIGPHVPPKEWRPVLEKLIASGKVIREVVQTVTPIGQNRTITVIRLPDTQPYACQQ
jgi:hypothetical protein